MPDPKSLGYMPTLDGVRGLACILVILEHVDTLLKFDLIDNPIGSLGVMLFFSLSGFLMGALYFGDRCEVDEAGKYAVSRFSRIVPAYYIAITFCLVLYLLVPDFEYEMSPINLLRSYAFMGSVGVFWSIPPEVQFYGFFLFLWFSYAQYRKGKYLWAIMAALVTVFFVATSEKWGGILLPSKLHVFLFGVGAALLLKRIYAKGFRIPTWAQIALPAAFVLYYSSLDTSEQMYHDLFFSALVGLTIMCLSVETKITAIFAMAFMRFVGAASFSIYLFHEPIMHVIIHYLDSQYLQLAFTLTLALGLPVLFHIYAEKSLTVKAKGIGLRALGALKGRSLIAS